MNNKPLFPVTNANVFGIPEKATPDSFLSKSSTFPVLNVTNTDDTSQNDTNLTGTLQYIILMIKNNSVS